MSVLALNNSDGTALVRVPKYSQLSSRSNIDMLTVEELIVPLALLEIMPALLKYRAAKCSVLLTFGYTIDV